MLRAAGLGDLLTAVPALRGVRRAWPRARVTLAGPLPLGEWARRHGLADDLLPAEGAAPPPRLLADPSGPVDVAVNLHGRGPQSHRLLAGARPSQLVAFRCPEAGHDDGPQWCRTEHEVDRWVRLLRTAGGDCSAADLRLPAPAARGDHVVVHPGAAAGSRRWPAQRWAAVAAALRTGGRDVVVTGTAPEAELCRKVATAAGAEDRCGRDDLTSLSHVVGTAALLLCGDTGVAHLATAYGTPSVLLFGPVPPDAWGPRVNEDRHRVLWNPHPHDPPGDPHGESVDLRLARVGVDDVLAAALDLAAPPGSAPAGGPPALP